MLHYISRFSGWIVDLNCLKSTPLYVNKVLSRSRHLRSLVLDSLWNCKVTQSRLLETPSIQSLLHCIYFLLCPVSIQSFLRDWKQLIQAIQGKAIWLSENSFWATEMSESNQNDPAWDGQTSQCERTELYSCFCFVWTSSGHAKMCGPIMVQVSVSDCYCDA